MNNRQFIMRTVSFLLIGLGLCSTAHASLLKAIEKNREAIKLLEKENPTGAENALLSGLAEDPFNPLLHLNLGLVFEIEEKYEKALKEADSVLRIQNLPPEIQFYAHFNAGNAAAKKEDIDLALKHFQAALDVNPESKETKTNIELLIKSGQGKGKGGKGGGKGQDQSKNEKKDGDGDKDKDDDKKDKPIQNGLKQKPQFNSENLTKEDVRKILDEIKSQEQRIRALDYASKSKDSPPAKDW